MPSDRRKTPRQDMQWKALIVGDGGSVVGECMTVNVSAAGARLLLPPSMEVPDSFGLILAKIGGVRRECEVTWRSDKGVGVKFVQSSPAEHEASHPDDALARISAKD
jgi:PilZ domain